jgi:hypothetical protein
MLPVAVPITRNTRTMAVGAAEYARQMSLLGDAIRGAGAGGHGDLQSRDL